MAYGDVSVINSSATDYVRVGGVVFAPSTTTDVPIVTFKKYQSQIESCESLYVLASEGSLASQAAAAENLVDNPLTYTPVNFTAADTKLQTIIGGIDSELKTIKDDLALQATAAEAGAAIDAAVLAATFTSVALSGANDPTTLLDVLHKIDAALAAHSL